MWLIPAKRLLDRQRPRAIHRDPNCQTTRHIKLATVTDAEAAELLVQGTKPCRRCVGLHDDRGRWFGWASAEDVEDLKEDLERMGLGPRPSLRVEGPNS